MENLINEAPDQTMLKITPAPIAIEQPINDLLPPPQPQQQQDFLIVALFVIFMLAAAGFYISAYRNVIKKTDKKIERIKSKQLKNSVKAILID